MKYIIKLSIIISFVFILFSCKFFNDINKYSLNNQIHIRFKEVNFGGDWNHYAGRVNIMEVELSDDIYQNSHDAIKLKEPIEYDQNGTPSLPFLKTEDAMIFVPSQKEPVLQSITTRFLARTENKETITEETITSEIFQILQRGTINDITLSYDMRNITQVQFNAVITNDTAIVSSTSDTYNFDVRCEYIKTSNYSISESINFVVMAEGYRADQMHYFRSYVEDAFKNYSNLHYTEKRGHELPHKHIPNDFFGNWWDRINVVMYETVSIDSGINTNFYNSLVSKKRSFFNIIRGEKTSGSTERMRRVVDENVSKTNLGRGNIDAYIIFANDEEIGCYSFSHFFTVDKSRNKQPVTYAIIQAPFGYLPNEENFHRFVKTDAIAHELGHAIAQLQDEYIIEPSFFNFYLEEFRNISNNTYGSFKWHKLIDVDSTYFNNEPVLSDNEPDITKNDNRLVRYRYPKYKLFGLIVTEFYIPTINSTMRGTSGYRNYQFGPVNTYFMEGSFMVRTGMLAPQNPFDVLGTGFSDYEWDGYSFKDFAKRWPPSRFFNP